jgi:hypothetical protein
MNREAILAAVRGLPREPVIMHLSDGTSFECRNPEYVLVEPPTHASLWWYPPEGPGRRIAIRQITNLEMIAVGDN